MARLTDEQAGLFLADNYAVVATLRADGSPHQTATWVDWDGEHVLFNITVIRKKYEELQRDPHKLSRKYRGRDYVLKPEEQRVIVSVTPGRITAYGFDS